MRSRILYVAVLLLVFGAWISEDRNRISARTRSEPKASSRPVQELSGLGLPVTEVVTGGRCNLESINGAPFGSDIQSVKRSTSLVLRGWAFDDKRARSPAEAVLRFAGARDAQYFYAGPMTISRFDVTNHFKLPTSLDRLGFELIADGSALPPGDYSISVILPFDDLIYVCDNGRKLRLE